MPDPTPSKARHLRVAAGTVLAGYWLLMFTLTHWPHVNLEHFPTNNDKLLHFTGYAAFGFLIAAWVSTKRVFGPRDFAKAFAVIFLYAIFDEVTQRLFGRDCEFLDMVADWTGGISGMSVFLFLRAIARRWQPAAGNIDSQV